MTPFQDGAGRRDHLISALLAGELWVFLNPIERDFAGASEDGEDCFVSLPVNGVVPPLASGHFAPIEIEDDVQLPTVP